MKKHIALTALTLILLAPGLAHAQSTSAVSRTTTVVERAAQEQGFETPSASSNYVVPSLSTMAPMAPDATSSPVTPSMAPSAAPYSGTRPGLVTNNGLPKGLVLNGPGTEEYKKKHRKKKKKAAAAAPVTPVETAPIESNSFAAPAPTPEAATAMDPAPAPAPATPAPEAVPPAEIPAIPAGDDPAMPAPSADPSTDPTPGELGPGGIEPPAPLAP